MFKSIFLSLLIYATLLTSNNVFALTEAEIKAQAEVIAAELGIKRDAWFSKSDQTYQNIEQGLREISILKDIVAEKGVSQEYRDQMSAMGVGDSTSTWEDIAMINLKYWAQTTHKQENLGILDSLNKDKINSDFLTAQAKFRDSIADLYRANGVYLDDEEYEEHADNYEKAADELEVVAARVREGDYSSPVVNLEPAGSAGEAKTAVKCNWSKGEDAGKYCLLAPLGNLLGGSEGKINIREDGMAKYLDGMFKAGVAIATGLTLVMIVIGGLQYVSTDAWGGKSEGRQKITQALLGLILALGTVLIVGEINPTLLRSDMDLNQNISLTRITGPGNTFDGGLQYIPGNGVLQTSQNLVDPTQFNVTANANLMAAERILQSAKQNLGFDTCLVVTENGRKGCGYAFGKIMKDAGIDIGLSDSEVLGTRAIYNALVGSSKFFLVPGGLWTSQPGDIVVSPTAAKVGHVGIVETTGATSIISNSSANAEIARNWTATRWINYYNGTQGLNTYVFRAKL